ncbi:phytoene synthase [Actinopolyspora xinjiangensis]|uniref:Phytoene synthase n=1 Tax=Actinopolyspora xinjiangensis TaxID=405564 RepID=A0A1H0WPF8_9ACTN|nr:phytoene/squalene synthase family protein [Actinopolyspora xinjiangensis]SDP92325.1 phytoene synthase [Actinopolyspora xinjiangensis]
MSERELDAAGIRSRRLRAAYRYCRRVNETHGRTYFLATRLLPPSRRPAIHALYGLAREVDDIVDDPGDALDERDKSAGLDELAAELTRAFAGEESELAVVRAVVDTANRYGIEQHYFHSFMASMRQDLTVSAYRNRAELNDYVYGSAEVIGLQVLPVLGTRCPAEEAAPYAAALGNAFQLTNFLRDVGEDLRRGRVYLPADELAAFDVDESRLRQCLRGGLPDRRVRRALADQVARTRAVYRRAAPGIAMLDPISRPCISTAYTLYGEILDRIVESGYDVFANRVSVSRSRGLGVALSGCGAVATARLRARLPDGCEDVSSSSMLGGR